MNPTVSVNYTVNTCGMLRGEMLISMLNAHLFDSMMYDMDWNVQNDDKFDDRDAHDDLDRMINAEKENQTVPEDSLNHEYDFLSDKEDINFEEKVCLELNEMGVLEINPEELRTWRWVWR